MEVVYIRKLISEINIHKSLLHILIYVLIIALPIFARDIAWYVDELQTNNIIEAYLVATDQKSEYYKARPQNNAIFPSYDGYFNLYNILGDNIGVLVKTSMFHSTIIGTRGVTYNSYPTPDADYLDDLGIKYSRVEVVPLGQYIYSNWEPICATTCMYSILRAENDIDSETKMIELLKDIPKAYAGLTGYEIEYLFRELGYKAELIYRDKDFVSNIKTALDKGNYILSGSVCGDIGHAELITGYIEIEDKTYFELMNPMGRYNTARYSLIDESLIHAIDSRDYVDTSEYIIDYIIIVEPKN